MIRICHDIQKGFSLSLRLLYGTEKQNSSFCEEANGDESLDTERKYIFLKPPKASDKGRRATGGFNTLRNRPCFTTRKGLSSATNSAEDF